MNRVVENNQVSIIGEIVSGFDFSHESFGEHYYVMDVKVERLSDTSDIIPVLVSERLVDVKAECSGKLVRIKGRYSSYNRHDGQRTRLVLYVFAMEMELVEETEENSMVNQIYLDGYICKEPNYRKTPTGREIADVLLAVNRPYGKSDYIPCIFWGRNARYVRNFRVGERCTIWGRIQSREYMKKLDEQYTEKRVAYEVSVSRLVVPENEE